MVRGVQLRRATVAQLLTAEAAVVRRLPQEAVAGRPQLEANQLMVTVLRSPTAAQAAALRWSAWLALNRGT